MPCRLGIKIIGTLTLYVHFGKVLKREIFHLRFILQAATCSRLVRFLAKLRAFSIIVIAFVKSWLKTFIIKCDLQNFEPFYAENQQV